MQQSEGLNPPRQPSSHDGLVSEPMFAGWASWTFSACLHPAATPISLMSPFVDIAPTNRELDLAILQT